MAFLQRLKPSERGDTRFAERYHPHPHPLSKIQESGILLSWLLPLEKKEKKKNHHKKHECKRTKSTTYCRLGVLVLTVKTEEV